MRKVQKPDGTTLEQIKNTKAVQWPSYACHNKVTLKCGNTLPTYVMVFM